MKKFQEEDTICYKVSECITEIENALTGEADLIKVAQRLHEIRQAAQHMENALKLRKKLMVTAGIENEYQEKKGINNTPTKDGINKIANKELARSNKPYELEFLVYENGELVYKSKSKAGVVSTVEEIEDIDETGTINGRTQKFMFGPPLAIWFAFNQLEHSMEARKVEVLAAMRNAVAILGNPALKKRLLNVANGRR